MPLYLSLQGLLLPGVCQKEAILFLDILGTPGDWNGCFVPWCVVGRALRGPLWPWASI